MENYFKNVKAAKKLLIAMDVLWLIMLNHFWNVVKKFQSSILNRNRENYISQKHGFRADISNSRVASLLKNVLYLAT